MHQNVMRCDANQLEAITGKLSANFRGSGARLREARIFEKNDIATQALTSSLHFVSTSA